MTVKVSGEFVYEESAVNAPKKNSGGLKVQGLSRWLITPDMDDYQQ